MTTPSDLMRGRDKDESAAARAPLGPCAKARVTCTIVTPSGERIVGENWCGNPQSVCQREPGEGYEKCKSICQQEGHAEAVAVRLAGAKAKGARAFLQGHTYACMDCQHALFRAGVVSLSVGIEPQANYPEFPDSSITRERLAREIAKTTNEWLESPHPPRDAPTHYDWAMADALLPIIRTYRGVS